MSNELSVEDLAAALRIHIDRTGCSQKKVADATGVSTAVISRILKGPPKTIRPATRKKLIDYLPEALLVERPPRPRPPARAPGLPPRVFLSSTYLDNAERHARILDVLGRLGMPAVATERFSADVRPTVEASIEKVHEADIFVGILAWRYGWIPLGEERSITEIEYDAAADLGIDRLMFLIDEDQERPRPRVDMDSGPDRGLMMHRLDAFKRRVQDDQMAIPFTDGDLAVKVYRALAEWWARPGGRKVGKAPKAVSGFPEEIDAYLRCVDAHYDSIDLAGFETKVRVPIALEDLYVSLFAFANPGARRYGRDLGSSEEVADEEDFRKDHEAIPLVEAFPKTGARALLILGDPGSGKTTHLKRLLLRTVRQGPESLGLSPTMVPAFLPLRLLEAADLDGNLGTFLDRIVRKLPDPPKSGFGKRLVQKRPVLFLLDGLDEVPADLRARVSGWITKAMGDKRHQRHRFVVTCRYAGYGDGVDLGDDFLELHLRPLEQSQVEKFIENWYRIVETSVAPDKPAAEARGVERACDLVECLRKPEFRARRVFEMTRNPLLLTAICLVHRDRGSYLPKDRSRLYGECVNVLLERWRDAKHLPVSMRAEHTRSTLQPMAFFLHSEEGRTRATSEELLPVLETPLREAGWRRSTEEFLATIRDESGLLTGWSHDTYGFMHLGFQEYLAARDFRNRAFEEGSHEVEALAERFGESWWREVILLALALDEPPIFSRFFARVVKTPAFASHAEFVNECLDEARRVTPKPFLDLLALPPGRDRDLWARQLVAARVVERIAPEKLEAQREALARHPFEEIKDRYGAAIPAGRKTARVERAKIELVLIPGGTFLMGSAPEEEGRRDSEGPQHEVVVPAFWLARTPVTNEQYGRFLATNPDHREPQQWANRQYNKPDQPVVGVSWHDAKVYCAWADLVLPSEAQWEYACRAGTETRYWSGNSEENLAQVGWYKGNFENRLHAVGEKPPNGFGLFDMHGNVWEWCEDTWHGDYEAVPSDGSAWVDDGAVRVLRGGCFFGTAKYARAAIRNGDHPGLQAHLIGFRPGRPLRSNFTSSSPPSEVGST